MKNDMESLFARAISLCGAVRVDRTGKFWTVSGRVPHPKGINSGIFQTANELTADSVERNNPRLGAALQDFVDWAFELKRIAVQHDSSEEETRKHEADWREAMKNASLGKRVGE